MDNCPVVLPYPEIMKPESKGFFDGLSALQGDNRI